MSAAEFSAALRRALAHREALPVRSVEVPEWGSESGPLVVYWRPWSAWEKRQVYGASGLRDEYQIACRIVERKALDSQGRRLFRDGEGQMLERGAHDAVVSFLARVIINDRDADEAREGGGENDAPERAADMIGTNAAVEAAAKN